MNLLRDIEQKYHKFRAEDFNHRKPNTIFMSVDLFHDFLRNGKPEYSERSVTDPTQWTILGMDVCIIENKRNFMHVGVV